MSEFATPADQSRDQPRDQPPRLRRFALWVLEAVATLVALALLALGLLCARLAIGPMSTDALTPVMAHALSNPARGLVASIAHGELAWDRDRHALYAHLSGLVLTGQTGDMVAAAPDIEARLSIPALARGSVKLDDISVRAAHVRLERLTGGQLVPYGVEAPKDDQPAPDVATILGALPSHLRWLNLSLTHLGRVTLSRTQVTLTDRASGETQTATLPDLTLGQGDNGRVQGSARIALTLTGDAAADPQNTLDLSLAVDLDPVTGAGTVGLSWQPIRLATLSGLNPGLAFLAGADLPVGGQLAIAYADPRSSALRLELQSGGGSLQFPNRSKPIAVRALAASFVTQQTVKAGVTLAALKPLRMEFAGTDKDGPALDLAVSMVATGEATDPARTLTADAALDGVPVDQVPGLWPPGLAPGALEWVAANMRGGTLTQARVHAAGTLRWPDPDSLQLGTLAGTLAVDGTTVSYFGELPPVTGASATATLDDKQMKVTILGGSENGVALQPSTAVVDYSVAPETIDIAIRGAGPASKVLEVIDHAPLHYAQRIGVKPADVAGSAGFALRMAFPLLKELPVEKIRLGLDGTIKGFATSQLLRGINLADGDLKLALDTSQLTVTGPLTASGVPASVVWHETFDPPAGQPASVCDAKLAVDRAGLVKLGLDDETAQILTGTLPLTVKYQRFARGVDQIDVTGDMMTAGLELPQLSYQKKAGTPGTATAKLRLQSGAPIEVSALAVTAPGLTFRAHGLLTQSPLRIQRVQVDQGQFGATTLAADLTRLNGDIDSGWRGTIKAGLLDVSQYIAQKTDGPPKPWPAMDLTLDADRVIFGKTPDAYKRAREATAVHAGLRRDGQTWQKLDVGCQVREVPFSYSLVPDGPRGQKLDIDTSDLGAILRATDQSDFMIGGKLTVHGAMATPFTATGAPLLLDIRLDDYRVRNAPFIASLVSAISASGLLNALSGQEGLGFDHLRAKADWQPGPTGGQLHIDSLKTSGGALGLTAAGNVDLSAGTVDLQGTAVPFNSVNSLLGNIPLVGSILGGSSGIFAAAYTAKGPVATPDVRVNPLSILAPGFLRDLFFVGDTPKADAPAPAAVTP